MQTEKDRACGGILRFNVYPQGDNYVAQCVDYDFATQGTSIADLEASLSRVIAAYVDLAMESGRTPFESVPSAPKEELERFRGNDGLVEKFHVRLEYLKPERVSVPGLLLQVA